MHRAYSNSSVGGIKYPHSDYHRALFWRSDRSSEIKSECTDAPTISHLERISSGKSIEPSFKISHSVPLRILKFKFLILNFIYFVYLFPLHLNSLSSSPRVIASLFERSVTIYSSPAFAASLAIPLWIARHRSNYLHRKSPTKSP